MTYDVYFSPLVKKKQFVLLFVLYLFSFFFVLIEVCKLVFDLECSGIISCILALFLALKKMAVNAVSAWFYFIFLALYIEQSTCKMCDDGSWWRPHPKLKWQWQIDGETIGKIC